MNKSQKELLIEYLKAGNTITGLEALNLFNVYGGFRARISEIIKDGYNIKSKFIKTNSGKSIKQYWIESQIKLL